MEMNSKLWGLGTLLGRRSVTGVVGGEIVGPRTNNLRFSGGRSNLPFESSGAIAADEMSMINARFYVRVGT